MNNKRSTAVFIALIMGMMSYAQDFHFSGFMQNMVYVNPAYAALPSSAEIGLTYRNQWPGIPATFVTYGAALVIPVQSLNSGVGIVVSNDMQGSGVINQTSVGLQYGYLIELNSNWQVAAGLSAAWVMKQFNAEELVFRSDLLNELGYGYPNVTFDNYSKSYPDFSAGVIVRHAEYLSFGISASHLTRPEHTLSQLAVTRLPLKYTGFLSGRIGGNRRNAALAVEPALFLSKQGVHTEIIWGTMFDLYSPFKLGSWLRHNSSFNFDALIITAAFSWEKYNISYSYDVNLKKINPLSTKMAAHEVTFLYRFEYKDEHKVKRFRKSECPAY